MLLKRGAPNKQMLGEGEGAEERGVSSWLGVAGGKVWAPDSIRRRLVGVVLGEGAEEGA